MFSCKRYGLGFFVDSEETLSSQAWMVQSSVVLRSRLNIACSAKQWVTVAGFDPLLNCAHAQKKLQ